MYLLLYLAGPHISAHSCVQAKSAEIKPKPHYYSHEVSKLELDWIHTCGHGQLSLSTSSYMKVPRDAYNL